MPINARPDVHDTSDISLFKTHGVLTKSSEQNTLMNKYLAARAFTLIELSIVLVIIGLIVGGVLVGRDLIYAAEIRKTISQIEKINTAFNTFRVKYNCLPGDCKNATDFGMADNGTGDGIIGTTNGSSDISPMLHLYQVGLIDFEIDEYGVFFKSPLNSNSYSIWIDETLNPGSGPYIMTLSIYNSGVAGECGYNSCPSMTSNTAKNIDSKIDDGMPKSGYFMALGAFDDAILMDQDGIGKPSEGPAGDDTSCVTDDTTSIYNNLDITDNLCSAMIRFKY